MVLECPVWTEKRYSDISVTVMCHGQGLFVLSGTAGTPHLSPSENVLYSPITVLIRAEP